MADELRRKKRVRVGHKSSATKMITKAEELLAASGLLDLNKLDQIGMSLKEKLEEIKVLDSEVLELVENAELEEEISQADRYKEQIFSTLSSIEKAVRPAPLPPATTAASPSHAIGAGRTPSAAHGSKVRLPKLTIKTFNDSALASRQFNPTRQ